jgi:acetyltransferase-like isoleucine patch superfamily enzyme
MEEFELRNDGWLRQVKVGRDVRIHPLVNAYECAIGDGSQVGAFVELQCGVNVGSNCKISSHSFLCEGVTLQDGVFVGHGVMFTNDRWPRATDPDGKKLGRDGWKCLPTVVGRRASIGSGCTILPGIEIGEGVMIGAGSVVTKSVPARHVAFGNPARVIRPLAENEF